jgi:hypothetical protein
MFGCNSIKEVYFGTATNRRLSGVSWSIIAPPFIWEFDGQDWTQQADGGPPARESHSMAYDIKSARVLLFGGQGGPPLRDTWAWDGQAWVMIASFGPARTRASLTCMGDAMLLFGGIDGTGINGDTWGFDGKYWTQRQDIGPVRRSDHAIVFDNARSRVVLFGGNSLDGNKQLVSLGDTWEHQEDQPSTRPAQVAR